MSHDPTQKSSPGPHIPKGRISCIQEPVCSWQLPNLSLVPGSSTASLQQEMAPTLPVLAPSQTLGALAQPHPPAEGSSTGQSSCTSQQPVLPTGNSLFLCFSSSCRALWQQVGHGLDTEESPAVHFLSLFLPFWVLRSHQITSPPPSNFIHPSIHPPTPDLSLQPCLLHFCSLQAV